MLGFTNHGSFKWVELLWGVYVTSELSCLARFLQIIGILLNPQATKERGGGVQKGKPNEYWT